MRVGFARLVNGRARLSARSLGRRSADLRSAALADLSKGDANRVPDSGWEICYRWNCRMAHSGAEHSLPPRSTAGQLTLDQHIGVRIPGGQPITPAAWRTSNPAVHSTAGKFAKSPWAFTPLLSSEILLSDRLRSCPTRSCAAQRG